MTEVDFTSGAEFEISGTNNFFDFCFAFRRRQIFYYAEIEGKDYLKFKGQEGEFLIDKITNSRFRILYWQRPDGYIDMFNRRTNTQASWFFDNCKLLNETDK